MMCSNAKHHVAPTAVLILILCVLSTNQTLFSRKKSTTPAAPVDNFVQQPVPVPQKESSHWWQIKHKPVESSEHSGSNQVSVAVPVPIHQKLQSIFETHFNSDVKWVPCLCPMRKGGEQQSNQKQPQPQQSQPQPQQQQQQQQSLPPPQPNQQYGPSHYISTTEAPSDNDYVPRFIFANYPIEA